MRARQRIGEERWDKTTATAKKASFKSVVRWLLAGRLLRLLCCLSTPSLSSRLKRSLSSIIMMRPESVVATADEVCASCGKAALDDVKLKKCACKLVKYCSIECQKNHRPQHKKACKKRVKELRDDRLFEQPGSSYLGECPICFLPQPLDTSKSAMMPCCSQLICRGCEFANQKREFEGGLDSRCPFCREPSPTSEEDVNKNIMKRIKKNDPIAMRKMGEMCRNEGDYETAFEYSTRAAEMGDTGAHFNLSCMYTNGQGVEKDMKKAAHHWEEAAIGGHPIARRNLGCFEVNNGKYERAAKHFIIAANLEDNNSLEGLRTLYANGRASKEDYASALRAYQVAVDATKSVEREKAEEAIKSGVLRFIR